MPLSEVSTSGLDRSRTFLPTAESPRSPLLSPKQEPFRPLPLLSTSESVAGSCASDGSKPEQLSSMFEKQETASMQTLSSAGAHIAVDQHRDMSDHGTKEVDSSDDISLNPRSILVYAVENGTAESGSREEDMGDGEGEEMRGEYSESEVSEGEGTPEVMDDENHHAAWKQTRFMDAGQMPVRAALSHDGELHVIGSYKGQQLKLEDFPSDRSYSLQEPRERSYSLQDGQEGGERDHNRQKLLQRKTRSDTEREAGRVSSDLERVASSALSTRFGRAQGVVQDMAAPERAGTAGVLGSLSPAAVVDVREGWREEEGDDRQEEECIMQVRAPLPAEDEGDLDELNEAEIWDSRDRIGGLGETRDRIGSGFLEVIVATGGGYEAGDEGEGEEYGEEDDDGHLKVDEGRSMSLPESAAGLPLAAQGFF